LYGRCDYCYHQMHIFNAYLTHNFLVIYSNDDTRTKNVFIYLFRCWRMFSLIISSIVVNTFEGLKIFGSWWNPVKLLLIPCSYFLLGSVTLIAMRRQEWKWDSQINFNKISFNIIGAYLSYFVLLVNSLEKNYFHGFALGEILWKHSGSVYKSKYKTHIENHHF